MAQSDRIYPSLRNGLLIKNASKFFTLCAMLFALCSLTPSLSLRERGRVRELVDDRIYGGQIQFFLKVPLLRGCIPTSDHA